MAVDADSIPNIWHNQHLAIHMLNLRFASTTNRNPTTVCLPWSNAVDIKGKKCDVNPFLALAIEQVLALGIARVQARVVGGPDVSLRFIFADITKGAS